MPHIKSSDIPPLSDLELEKFLNITIAELIPEKYRIQEMLYNRDICIVDDLLKRDKNDMFGFGKVAYKLIGIAIQNAIQALIEQRNESPRP